MILYVSDKIPLPCAYDYTGNSEFTLCSQIWCSETEMRAYYHWAGWLELPSLNPSAYLDVIRIHSKGSHCYWRIQSVFWQPICNMDDTFKLPLFLPI
jgi:hypothetical protein